MNRTNKILLLIVMVLAVAGLFVAAYYSLRGPTAAPLPQPKEVRLTERQGACGSGVGLKVGDTLELVLDSHLTGYLWEIGFNVPAVLKVTGQPSRDPASNADGVGSTDTFRLTAVGEGEETLRLVYRLETDASVAPTRTCQVNIVVIE